ncbi:MAG: ATP-grasp domain-containing protein [Patescibacteria group bacterium]
MQLLKIGVLRGGPSREYEVSLKTGQNIINNLPIDKYNVEDIYISREGIWYRDGLPTTPLDALRGIDVIINGLHGDFGEDGRVQRIMDGIGIPYTGSKAFGATNSINKDFAKGRYKKNYLKTPEHVTFRGNEEDVKKIALDLFRNFPQPSIIKPVYGGSSKDVYYCDSYQKIFDAIDTLSKKNEPFLIEEYIKGKEASVSVLEDFRDEDLYAFPPTEIGKTSPFFSYEQKYNGVPREVFTPGSFTFEEKEMLKELAREAHDSLDLRQYSQSDFIVSPRGIYILETNALPGLTETSILPEVLQSVGLNLPLFLDHIINLSLKGK